MHFRPYLAQDLMLAMEEIKRAGLTPAFLDDYLPLGTPVVPPIQPVSRTTP